MADEKQSDEPTMTAGEAFDSGFGSNSPKRRGVEIKPKKVEQVTLLVNQRIPLIRQEQNLLKKIDTIHLWTN